MTGKLLVRALKKEKVERPPVWLMRQAGRYLPEYRELRARAGSFLELCDRPELAVEVSLQPLRRFEMDAAIVFADILLLPRALGQNLHFAEGEGPVLAPVRDLAALRSLSAEHLHRRLAPVYETIRRLARELPGETALIGFAGAPWTVATYMVEGRGSADQAAARQWARRDPDGFQELIDLLTGSTISYLDAQARAGAEVIQIFDTWAGVLSGEPFERWCVEPVARIAESLAALHPEVPLIGFPRGAGEAYRDFFRRAKVQGVSIDSAVDVTWAATNLQPLGAVQGNLDPLVLVDGGGAMTAAVENILKALGGGPFVFNLGHGIVPQTPPGNVADLVAQVRAWRP